MNTNGPNYAVFHLPEWRMRYLICTLLPRYQLVQVEDVIESKARSLDVITAHSYYELLYSYYVAHSNYRKGVSHHIIFLP